MANKQLSLIHLELGLALAARHQEGQDVIGEMVAVYLAEPTALIRSRKDPAVLDALRDTACCMPADEAAELLADFIEACGRFAAKLQGSSKEPNPAPGQALV